MRPKRFLFILPLLLLLVACGGDEAAVTPTAVAEIAPASTATGTLAAEPRPATVIPSATPATEMAAAATVTAPPPAGTGPITPTPYPGATPTAGTLNAPVPTVPTGGASCEDYPCPDDAEGWVSRIQLPPGFSATTYGLVDVHPTSITFGPDGLLYVARQEGEIVTVAADGTVTPYVGGFYYLVAIAFQPGTERLFASSRVEGDREATIWVIEDGAVTELYGGLPCCYGGWHQANGIAFGPDGYGYVSVGARSDHGETTPLHPLEASVLRFDPAGGQIEPFASGLRNTFDITWDGSGRLFGADNMPDHGPPEEFNRIEPGREHGFPYYDCEECTPPPPDADIVPPLHKLLPHSAPTGVTAYLHDQFPGAYNNLFLTLWSAFPGAQKIVRFGPNGQGMTDFATGFAAPVDVTVGPAGSLYVADWATGVIFKITYGGS